MTLLDDWTKTATCHCCGEKGHILPQCPKMKDESDDDANDDKKSNDNNNDKEKEKEKKPDSEKKKNSKKIMFLVARSGESADQTSALSLPKSIVKTMLT